MAITALLLVAPRLVVGQDTTAIRASLAKIKVREDSLFKEACRNGTVLSTGGCSGSAGSPRVTYIRRHTQNIRAERLRIDSLLRAMLPPVQPPADTQPTPLPTPDPVIQPSTGFVGPAELPRQYLNFTYPPATRTVTVSAGANLQAVLNAAQNGDHIVLPCGASWTGNFTLPAKSGGWVVVRTNCLQQLPPQGTRVSPSAAPLMAKLETVNTDAALAVTGQTCGWWFAGIEFSVSPLLAAQQYGIVTLGDAYNSVLANVPCVGQSQGLVFDRVYVHGATTTNGSRCFAFNAARIQLTESFVTECHGRDFDSQAILSWNGPGPYRITNNYLAGAGENIMFGGSPPAIQGMIGCDIEIRRNHIITPLSWKGVWQKKNLLETKNACRMLVQANVFENSWGEHGGVAVILKSNNQDNGCRWCRSTDITVRDNWIRGASSGVIIAGVDPYYPIDTTARRIAVRGNVFDLGAPGDHRGFLILTGAQTIAIDSNVVAGIPAGAGINSSALYGYPGATNGPCWFRGNVWTLGSYGVYIDGGNAGAADGLNKMCGVGKWTWADQTIIAGSSTGWPTGTTATLNEANAAATAIRNAVTGATAGVVVPP